MFKSLVIDIIRAKGIVWTIFLGPITYILWIIAVSSWIVFIMIPYGILSQINDTFAEKILMVTHIIFISFWTIIFKILGADFDSLIEGWEKRNAKDEIVIVIK